MSYDNAKACAVVETTADVNQNLINVDDQTAKSNFEIQPEIYDDHRNAPEGMFFLCYLLGEIPVLSPLKTIESDIDSQLKCQLQKPLIY